MQSLPKQQSAHARLRTPSPHGNVDPICHKIKLSLTLPNSNLTLLHRNAQIELKRRHQSTSGPA